MTTKSDLIRIQQTALDGRGRAGGDIHGTMESHYACHIAEALYLVAEAVATAAVAIVDALPTKETSE